jgi:large subunit ribosomal protein L6
MSRIGKRPIPVPAGVTVAIDGSKISVKGPKGELSRVLPADMIISHEGSELLVKRPTDEERHKALHGLTRTLVANMVEGVTKGFQKTLEITGVGYKAEIKPYGALLSLGDIHFAQGDGEVCGCAIETHGQARIRVSAHRNVRHHPTTPLIESTEPAFRAGRRHISTTGMPIDEDGRIHPMNTTLAAKNAIELMIQWLGDEAGLTREQAYVVCSASVDLRISEIVDVPHPVVSALCPLDIFTEIRPQRG